MISTVPDQEMDNLQFALPKGIWLNFDFDDSHPVCSTMNLGLLVIFSCFNFSLFLFFFNLFLLSQGSFLILFGSSQDLPALYLQGGAIIPLGPPHQHVGEASPSDDLTLIVALDEHGNFKSG